MPRTERLRQEDVYQSLDTLDVIQGDGSAGMLVQTFTQTTYPTSAGKFYAVHPVLADGTESEGASPTFTVDTSTTLYALNAGTQIPASGTTLIVAAVGGRLCFRYDG